ncbi:MAG: riboflavin synthase [Micrococcales bacterium]|nr:riboflavin synthase [Micrococcales bacterium]MCL2666779.1 riboflavin synthase [Micrococcales bacterium]
MFTGIIEEVGEIVAIDHDTARADARVVVRGPLVTSDASEGDSIAVSGVCLTVTSLGDDGTFAADVMPETLRHSMLGGLGAGDQVNLERAMSPTGRLGGHIVQGHVDGVGTIVARDPGERWDDVQIAVADDLARYVARKGSITIDGVSLTVTAVTDRSDQTPWAPQLGTLFAVSLIPATLTGTTLGRLVPGTDVNLEVDVIAKYTQRLLETAEAQR